MAFSRILALIKKDMAWCFGNRRILGSLLIGPIFAGFFLWIAIKANVLPGLQGQGGIPDTAFFSFFAIAFMAYMTGVQFTFSLIIQEKTKGTFLPLLCTPLRPLEFIFGKLFLSFACVVFFALVFVVVDVFVNANTMFALHPYLFLNVVLFSGLMCLLGCIIGLITQTEIEAGKVMLIPTLVIMMSASLLGGGGQLQEFYPVLDKIQSFNPLLHLFYSLQDHEWRILLFNTFFNFLFFTGFLIFTVCYIRFYFAHSRTKTFSIKLLAGLFCIIGLYVVSGFVSEKGIKSLKASSTTTK